MSTAPLPMISLRHVTKRFGDFTAVDDVCLDVRGGEFITLLGPSGCGKTTLLRMIGGFETPTRGAVLLDGADVTALPPYRRDVNQVFQSYALFPHLSVADNVAFGLRMKRLPRAQVEARVRDAIDLVSLGGLEHRRPAQLSGGQRQRVALARAVVNRPKVLLLDEPLSALDAKLRRAMQVELKRLQQRLGITFLLVTHDQEEALTMSDRIAVVNAGRIEQVGTVADVYHRPATTFVAGFIGHANIVAATVQQRVSAAESLVRVRGEFNLTVPTAALGAAGDGARVLVTFRPEKVYIRKARMGGANVFEAAVVDELFRGATDELLLRTPGGLELTAVVANESAVQEAFHEGDRVYCQLHPDDVVVVREAEESSPQMNTDGHG